METPPRRPPPTPRGRCLLGGELALPLASPISDRIRSRWRNDENDDAMVLNSPFPTRPQPMRLDDVYHEVPATRVVDVTAQVAGIEPRGGGRGATSPPLRRSKVAPTRKPIAVRTDAVVGASAVRRSLRIMGLQKFSGKPESTPAKQAGKNGAAKNASTRGATTTTTTRRQPPRNRTPKRETDMVERKGANVQKRHRQS